LKIAVTDLLQDVKFEYVLIKTKML